MESIVLASIVTSLVLRAAEKSADKLGEAAADKISEVVKILFRKFQREGNNHALTVLEEDHPSEEQEATFREVLEAQIVKDSSFESQLSSAVEGLRKDVHSDQVLLKDIFAKNGIKIGDVSQSVKGKRASSQEAAINLETDGTLEIKSLSQEVR